MKRSVAELISKRDEPADNAEPKPPRNDAGNAFGDMPPNSRSRVIDAYPLCKQLIVSSSML